MNVILFIIERGKDEQTLCFKQKTLPDTASLHILIIVCPSVCEFSKYHFRLLQNLKQPNLSKTIYDWCIFECLRIKDCMKDKSFISNHWNHWTRLGYRYSIRQWGDISAKKSENTWKIFLKKISLVSFKAHLKESLFEWRSRPFTRGNLNWKEIVDGYLNF